MQNLTHPALRVAGGEPRPDVTVEEWEFIVERLSAAAGSEPNRQARRRLRAQYLDARAAKTAAWIEREAGLCGLLS